jgi:hypothetical protein
MYKKCLGTFWRLQLICKIKENLEIMSNINISNLNPAGSDLFDTEDSFLTELSEADTQAVIGGSSGGGGGNGAIFLYDGGFNGGFNGGYGGFGGRGGRGRNYGYGGGHGKKGRGNYRYYGGGGGRNYGNAFGSRGPIIFYAGGGGSKGSS